MSTTAPVQTQPAAKQAAPPPQPQPMALPAPEASPGRRTAQAFRRRMLVLSAILFVVLPSLGAAAYYAFVAADQYSVETRFAIRGPEGTGATDLLGMFTGVAATGSTMTDSYILMDYIHSKEILLKLAETIDVRKIFSHPDADWLSAFTDSSAPNETFIDYWRKMVRMSFDTSSRIMTVEVLAFSPEDALKLSQAILALSERLVNELSERSRLDAIALAQQEVGRMEDRLRTSSQMLREFRDRNQDIDPAQTALANVQRLSILEGQRNEARAKLASQRAFMKDDAPSIQVTLSQIEALEQQIAGEKARLGKGSEDGSKGIDTSTLSTKVNEYQGLLLEQEFAQKALVVALSSLERARALADQQQRYLGTFVPPRLPEEAIYPKRIVSTIIVSLAALALWVIGVLIVYAVRDHAT